MSAPLALTLFHQLCDVGNALEQLGRCTTPGSDAWCACTDIIIGVDTIIDTLVHSNGLQIDNEDA